MGKSKQQLTAAEKRSLLDTLEKRFQKNMNRHKGIQWSDVQTKLEASSDKCRSLQAMENSGGEPDVIGFEKSTGEFIFADCSAETPKGRRSTCYDREGLLSRKEHQPENNAVDMAAEMGIGIMTEAQYRALQQLGSFDTKTSSWIQTPEAIRKLGGALFCDKRYDHVFVYHNGAQSYYAARGFRGILTV